MKRRNVTITDKQDKWLRKKHIKLSPLVREKLEKEIKKRGN